MKISVQVILFPFLRGENSDRAIAPSVFVPNLFNLTAHRQYHFDITEKKWDFTNSLRVPLSVRQTLEMNEFHFSFNEQIVLELKS